MVLSIYFTMTKYYKRVYKPTNPQKYEGDPTKIICRSSWEIRFAKWCDTNPSILSWSSEEVVIPYLCPTDGRYHRYFVDFKIKIKTNTGIKVFLVEVKPYKQTIPPTKPKRNSKYYLQEVMTYGKNDAKWNAAREYCKNRGWDFMLITEYELGLVKRSNK